LDEKGDAVQRQKTRKAVKREVLGTVIMADRRATMKMSCRGTKT